MAVPGRRNGLDDDLEAEGLFDAALELGDDIPPHLQALTDAAQRGDVDALRVALDNLSVSIDEPLEDGDTALHLACLYGHIACVELLIERGASIDIKDEEGAIPLHDACAGGFIEIVEMLLNAANSQEKVKGMLDTVDAEGDTPLHHAARGEHLNIVLLLLGAGASSLKTNIYGKIPAELPDPGTEVKRVLEDAMSSGSLASQ